MTIPDTGADTDAGRGASRDAHTSDSTTAGAGVQSSATAEGAFPESQEPSGPRRPSSTELLGVVDALAARRPVAARLVAMTGDDSVGSRELAATVVADVALTARVLKLANSAYFGLGGRVRTVSFAITVVGFAAVRAMAATAATGLDTDDQLSGDFWPRSKATALASSELAPLFGVPAPDAFCVGLLSGLGQAILAHHDSGGYPELLAAAACADGSSDRSALLAAETARYGLRHTEVSAAVLTSWAFPSDLTDALHHLDAPGQVQATRWSQCLASAVEAASRLTSPQVAIRDVLQLSGGVVTEDRLHALLPHLGEAVAASDW